MNRQSNENRDKWIWNEPSTQKSTLRTSDYHTNNSYNGKEEFSNRPSSTHWYAMGAPREYRIHSNSSKALGERRAVLIKSPTQLGEAKECYCRREKWWLLWMLTGGNLRRPFSPNSCEPGSNQRKVFYLHMSWEDGVMDVLEAVVSPAVELLAWNKGRGVKIASALNQCDSMNLNNLNVNFPSTSKDWND